MPKLDLTGSTVVVTGAAHGMGAEVARQLAARGVGVALVDRDRAGLEHTRDTIGTLPAVARAYAPPITVHTVDLTDDAAVRRVADEAASAHPRLAGLITCAGSSMLGSIDQLTMAEMRWLMDVNLWGTVNITQALLPALRRSPPRTSPTSSPSTASPLPPGASRTR